MKFFAANPISNNADVEALRRVPSRAVPVTEILAYFLLPPLFVMCGVMPTTAIFILPMILPMLFLLYRRFGAYLPFSCIAAYCALALAFNYDILTVIYSVALLFALAGLLLANQQSHYLACAAFAAVFAIVGAFVGVGIVRLAEDKPLADIASGYVQNSRDDPLVSFFARDYYDALVLPDDIPKLKPGDDGYFDEAIDNFAEWAGDEFGYYTFYYCIHYGGVFAALAYFISVAVCRRTASPYDFGASAEEVGLSTRCMGGVRVMPLRIADMKLPRSYLWTCVLPAAVCGIVLGLFDGYEYLSSTVMHTFATLPSAFGAVTLLAYFAELFKGKTRTVAVVIVWAIGIAMAVFPFLLFILSIIGLCDCVLNIRFWTEFIRSDG